MGEQALAIAAPSGERALTEGDSSRAGAGSGGNPGVICKCATNCATTHRISYALISKQDATREPKDRLLPDDEPVGNGRDPFGFAGQLHRPGALCL